MKTALQTPPARPSRHLVPWLVSQRDLIRYFSRVLRACRAGRVVLFPFRSKKDGTTVMLALVRAPDNRGAAAAAWASFRIGRVIRVRLEELPPIRRARRLDAALTKQAALAECRSVFLECGLPYGRHFGSKSGYALRHPARLYIANACVVTRDRVCIWRGDLDLAVDADRDGLISASHLLHRQLYILREQAKDDATNMPMHWFMENAVATAWRGRVETTGYMRRLYGSLQQVISRSAGANKSL